MMTRHDITETCETMKFTFLTIIYKKCSCFFTYELAHVLRKIEEGYVRKYTNTIHIQQVSR